MSKPEPPKKIDPLPIPAPRAAEGKKPEVKKTGWEPPTPQNQRALERKLGMLLAVCLLVALGFVAHRKFYANQKPASPDLLAQKFGELPDAGGELPTNGNGTSLLPPTSLGAHTDSPAVAEFAPSSSTPAEMTFASSIPPEQPLPEQDEPAAGAYDVEPRVTPTFDLTQSDPPTQTEPQAVASDDLSNPFLTSSDPPPRSESTSEPPLNSANVESDPFGSSSVAVSDPEPAAENTMTFSSDADSSFGTAPDAATAAPEAEITFSEPPDQSEPEPTPTGVNPPEQVVDLFSIEPVQESPVEQPAPVAVSENDAPQLLEPNDAQVMPTLKIGPFDTAATEPTQPVEPTPTESPATEPSATEPADPGFRSFPEATADTQVQPRKTLETPTENPFTHGGVTTVMEVAPRDLHDPFSPARDVRQAVSENVEVIHDVQSGENFWSIAKQHYGSGKYFTALAAYNKSRIPDSQRIRPGMKVQVPSEAVLAQQYPQLVSGTKPSQYTTAPAGPPGFSLDPHGRPQYRVSKGDTLSDIAQRHLGRASRWRQIFGMNMDQLPSAESLTTGMVLRLPPDASQIPISAAELRSR